MNDKNRRELWLMYVISKRSIWLHLIRCSMFRNPSLWDQRIWSRVLKHRTHQQKLPWYSTYRVSRNNKKSLEYSQRLVFGQRCSIHHQLCSSKQSLDTTLAFNCMTWGTPTQLWTRRHIMTGTCLRLTLKWFSIHTLAIVYMFQQWQSPKMSTCCFGFSILGGGLPFLVHVLLVHFPFCFHSLCYPSCFLQLCDIRGRCVGYTLSDQNAKKFAHTHTFYLTLTYPETQTNLEGKKFNMHGCLTHALCILQLIFHFQRFLRRFLTNPDKI